MTQLSFNEPAGVLIKTTCVDFPGLVAGSFFLKGCNLRCPYCYNTMLVTGKSDENDGLSSVNELFLHLEKRQGILKGLVISGGEPLLNPYTPFIIKKAKSLGYKIKLDTNGTLSDELEAFVFDKELKPDFIAMDIKTSPKRYATEICPEFSKFFENTSYFEKKLRKSAEIISENFKHECYEFRTVLVPELVQKEDIEKMAEILPKDASWQFAQFQGGNCLNPAYNEIIPYSDNEISELIEFAKTFIPGAELR